MKPPLYIFLLAIFVVAGLVLAGQNTREISLSDLRDKIEGGWAGQMIGVSYGAPTEFKSKQKINEGELPKWTPERVSNSLTQDDLYVDMTFAKVLDDKGLNATSDDFGAMFRNSKYPLWHANYASRRNLRRGIPAALAGSPKYSVHANDIDFQIEADFVGLMCPGLPQSSNEICYRAGRVMNYGDGIYGGMFMSAMYATAYFEKDPRKVVEAGLASIPAKSRYAKLISDLLAWSKQYPDDWRKVWKLMEDKWDNHEVCPTGVLDPFNIDASLNGGYVALGLLYGGSDFGKTIDIATRAGQDSDCNPATAGGILGVMLGYKQIPDLFKGGIPKIANEKFQFTDFSFHTIVDSTQKRAIALVKKTGGQVQGDKLMVKIESPKPARLEVWDDFGTASEQVAAKDPRWTWKGNWTEKGAARIANQKGAEALIDFEGSGAMIRGSMMAAGGKAEVYLDGKLHQKVDAFSYDEKNHGEASLWYAFSLKNGRHTVRVVVLGETVPDSVVGGDTYPGSKGTDVAVMNMTIFR